MHVINPKYPGYSEKGYALNLLESPPSSVVPLYGAGNPTQPYDMMI
jgi:hypothetical protein